MVRSLKGLLIAGVLVGMLAAAPSLEAKRRNNSNCGRRVRQAEMNLEKAIRRHGQHSRQAKEKRRKLEIARERCGAL